MPAPKDPIKREEWRRKKSVIMRGEKNHRYGTHPSAETVELLSKSHIGKIPWNKGKKCPQLAGENNPMFGKSPSIETRKQIGGALRGERNRLYKQHLPEETRKKMSISRTGKTCKEHHPQWKGGVSFLPYCYMFNRPFKNRVRARYDYKCVECEKTQEENGKLLDVHHVNYDKMVCYNDVKPLFVSLCRSCNTKANFNREYWEDHYTTIINEKYSGVCYLPEAPPSVENL
jgi:hypothetical protein